MSLIEERREQSKRRLDEVREALRRSDLPSSEDICVYVTGSHGRNEANLYSDLDLYTIARTEHSSIFTKPEQRRIVGILKQVARDLGFPEFDRDGKFLESHPLNKLIKTLGHPKDDHYNTFTARGLLLLESQPLFGEKLYSEAIKKVIKAYWRDYSGREENFVPAYLVNDILRLWRTFCVNYEAFTHNSPQSELAKRRLKNYKLRHSRLLTCYSAIAHLLDLYRAKNTVSPEDVSEMVQRTPIERLERLDNTDAGEYARKSIELYETFLEKTGAPKDQLLEYFLDSEKRNEIRDAEKRFGDTMYHLLRAIKLDGYLFRLLVI